MRVHWWQSIRWRLVLISLLVSFLATGLLALMAMLSILYYYGGDQKTRIKEIAVERAERISEASSQFPRTAPLDRSVEQVFPKKIKADPLYLIVVQDRRARILYPAKTAAGSATARFLATLSDPTTQGQKDDLLKLRAAITKGMRGTPTVDDVGKNFIMQPFVVQPIYSKAHHVLGVVIVTPLAVAERTIPPFIATVGGAILLAAPAVALLVALVALLFSLTITRPLARLTRATTTLASGNYSVQVKIQARDELGELANNFNAMAAQLKRDVEELQKQELWRRELLMSITHDLATPLTAIAGLGEALVDGVGQSREEYEATGRIIVRETLRLRRLVKDLHMMTKMEAGALEPQFKPVRIAALVDEVLAVLTPEFERVQVEPHNAIPFTLPAIQADPDMLTRVFSNLCDNALQHTPANGTITFEARLIRDQLAVAITDTGSGIPPEALPRIFERFFRADSARQSNKGGSGLGLAIAHAIIEAHQGRIWAENTREGGARFIFTLPLEPATTAASMSEEHTAPQFQRATAHLLPHAPPTQPDVT